MADNDLEKCLKCNESLSAKGRSKYGRICRPCVAEFLLSGEESKIDALLRIGTGMTSEIAPRSRVGFQRYSSCERCGMDTSYSCELPQSSVWCDDCGKNCCRGCTKRVIVTFETAGGETIDQNSNRFLCKTCIAGRILGNWKVKYVVKGPDGQETLQETMP